jgi:hypothetical protein
MIKVWSERREGSWDQCTEGAYLMALLYGGFRKFPEGAYSDAERDGLDNATPPDPPGGGSTFDLLDVGAQKRYGLTLDRIPSGTKAGLRRMLSTPGRGLAIAGSLGHFPVGHRLRRWQPGYTGGHAICVVSLGDGKVWWGDPLAPMRNEGDTTTVDNALTFAWYPSDARVIADLGLVGRRLRSRLMESKGDLNTLQQLIADLADDASQL